LTMLKVTSTLSAMVEMKTVTKRGLTGLFEVRMEYCLDDHQVKLCI
jgi:hypothetical protein